VPFIEYALRGFVDGLKEQLLLIKGQQLHIAWRDYIYAHFKDKDSPADKRRRHLILDLSDGFEPVSLTHIGEISPRVAREYAKKSHKTLRRDVKTLEEMGLVVVEEGIVRAKTETIEGAKNLRTLGKV
jgi:DNA-binding transcriptional ArsR family regulator